MGAEVTSEEKVYVAALYCRSSGGLLMSQRNDYKKESYNVKWDDWLDTVEKQEIENVWICPQTSVPSRLIYRQWNFCQCWQNFLIQKPSKIIAARFCPGIGGIVNYEDGRHDYEDWDIWHTLVDQCPSIWMCPEAIKNHGRLHENVQVWTQCHCWLSSFYH
jgi:hypothetical protein